ncbi:MAG: type II toxin-antitoxin system RelE family toxin [Actinomycetota bacterium]
MRAAVLALQEDPGSQSQKLEGENAYRKRVGDYRIIFRIDDAGQRVLVSRIKHRRDFYRR